MLSPEVLYVVGVFSFALQDGEAFLFAKYKRKALWYYQALEKSRFFVKTQSGSQTPTLKKKKSHMRRNSGQCDQYFPKLVKFTHSST